MHAPEADGPGGTRTLDFVLSYIGSNPAMFHVEHAKPVLRLNLDEVGGPDKASHRELGPSAAAYRQSHLPRKALWHDHT
jgi:hypothetical protein